MIIFLVLFSLSSFAQTKENFFPRFPQGQVIEERVIGKQKIERSLERQSNTYRYVVNYEELGKIRMEVAFPIHQLSQYSTCSMYATQPLEVSNHYERIWVDTYFKCVRPPDYDPVKLRMKMKDRFCADSTIQSEAQEIICKELMLK
jgi:hypothetical protein